MLDLIKEELGLGEFSSNLNNFWLFFLLKFSLVVFFEEILFVLLPLINAQWG